MTNQPLQLPAKKYMAFMDESGVSNLNDITSDFWLSTIIIEKNDFAIIEGYLQLLKRRFFDDDLKPLHACDLIEKTKECYPELDTARKANSFIQQLGLTLASVPFMSRMYFVDKDAVRAEYQYTPAPRRKVKDLNLEVAYEAAAEVAITDFTNLLIENDAKGEIMIESRLFNDAHFVSAFDAVRKRKETDGRWAQITIEAKNRITSLHIANKQHQDGGLELADLCAYVTMRHERDPANKGAVGLSRRIGDLYSPIKKHAYRGAHDTTTKLLHAVVPQGVKPPTKD